MKVLSTTKMLTGILHDESAFNHQDVNWDEIDGNQGQLGQEMVIVKRTIIPMRM